MTAAAETKHRALGLNSLGFTLVTLTAYLSALVTMGYVLNTITASKAALLITLAIIYLANGVWGYAFCRNRRSVAPSLAYLGTQIALSVSLLYLAKSPALLLAMFPLAGQAVVMLRPRLMLLTCAVMFLAVVVPMAIFGGWGPAAVLGMFLIAGIVFVVVITRLAIKEQRARAEVERLVAELKAANDKLQAYADQVEELATLTERNRLAREIHDSLGHYLTVVIVQIEAAIAMKESERDRSLASLRKAQGLAQKGLAEVRRSVTSMRLPGESRSLIDAMEALFEECRASGVATKFDVHGTPRKLAASAELTLYRAAQEGLTNVRKHSTVASASIALKYSDDTVSLIVHDEGAGASNLQPGFGLVGLRERVQLAGGEVTIATGRNEGFTLEISLPG